mmetsp:Transcript_64314/g.130684  ORF Transcript_64314/g.130684 Transcript_64314/m.130684 type:complete len:88 (+) Transcript_64314:299-562(+)
MRLQTYEEVTSTKHRLTLNRMKQRPVSRRVHKAFGVLCQEEGTPGTAHIFQVPTSSIAPVESVAFAVVSWVCGLTGVSNMVAGHADK